MAYIEQFFLRYFYLGNSKYAPGTVTSFCVVIIWFFLPDILLLQSFILIFHLILGFYFCYTFTSRSDEKDPGYIVIDEVVGMMISLYLIPKVFGAYLLAFILFRFFDIAKPSIIYRIQNLGYGVGIMMDDIISGILSLLVVMGLFY